MKSKNIEEAIQNLKSSTIAEAIVSESEKPPKVPGLELNIPTDPAKRSAAARANLREVCQLLERHEVKAVPARSEELTAGTCFKNVRRILSKRETLPN